MYMCIMFVYCVLYTLHVCIVCVLWYVYVCVCAHVRMRVFIFCFFLALTPPSSRSLKWAFKCDLFFFLEIGIFSFKSMGYSHPLQAKSR